MKKGYLALRPFNKKGIPVALDGRDMLSIAQTRTGKTAAFAIPILQHLSNWDAGQNRPTCRAATGRGGIMVGNTECGDPAPDPAPTRELAVQIGDSFRITENMSV